MIYFLPFLSFNYFTAPSELYKIALVPISTIYYYMDLYWLAGQAKMHKAFLF